MRRSLWLFTLLALVEPAQAQVGVDAAPRCSTCSIELERVAVLSGDRVLDAPMAMARTSDDHFVVSFYPRGDEVVVFDPTGTFLRVLARRGRGPGEVTRAGHIEVSADDSVRIYDNGRVLIYSPDLSFVRTEVLPLPAARDATRLQSGSSVIAVPTFMSDYGGSPLYMVENGEVKNSFGRTPGDPEGGPGSPFAIVRSLASNGVDRIWSAPLTRYEITEWDASGSMVRSWSTDVEGFAPWSEMKPISAEAPPDGRIADIRWLGDSRLLVMVAMPNPNWRDYLGPPSSGPDGTPVYNEADIHGLFHTRLDVWDLENSIIVTSRTEPRSLTALVDDHHVAGYRQDETGNPFIDVLRFTVVDGR